MSELHDLLRAARRMLVFTGAGISTGSGIPDFRGPQGVWKTRQPVYFDEFLASEDKRVEHWDFKAEAHELFANAKPNAAHQAIAALERMGRVQALVTQNIDGLHQLAGSGNVIELHGTNRWVECLSCWKRYEPGPLVEWFRAHRQCPRCDACGGWLKTATISFGQPLRPEILQQAAAHAARADLVLALGSTLSVQPAAGIPLYAVQRRVPYVIINQGDTDHDAFATLKIDGDVAAVLPPAVAALEKPD